VSRIGKLPIPLKSNITVDLKEYNTITIKGPKGELSRQFSDRVQIEVENDQILVARKDDDKTSRALHGLTRALLANMVQGVSDGFVRKLELVGVGYKAEMKGKKLLLNIGYSHPIVFGAPPSLTIATPTATEINISGIDKELVGAAAAKIRSFRKPEPYKGKGIKYAGEYIRRKAGKTAGK
jgi:large subunit ribosomal protein L6